MKSSAKAPKAEGFPEMQLRPVGVVRNRIKEPILVADSGDLEFQAKLDRARELHSVISEIVVNSDFAGILDGIEDLSHLLVLYWAHRIPPEGRSIVKAHPMGRKEFPLVGILATCSPARPNPVCVTTVRLLERRGNVLRVAGLDAIDGSPLIDIKPYVPSYYAAEEVQLADWMMQIEREFADGSFPVVDREGTG